jgi:hypothetical protein
MDIAPSRDAVLQVSACIRSDGKDVDQGLEQTTVVPACRCA